MYAVLEILKHPKRYTHIYDTVSIEAGIPLYEDHLKYVKSGRSSVKSEDMPSGLDA